MFHPLLAEPKDLKDQELDLKISELAKKYHIACNLGQGGVANQILIALEMYKDEQRKRYFEATNNIIKKQNKDLDDLINVD